MKKIGILQFPGSNCDKDVFKAVIYCQNRSFQFKNTLSKFYKPEFLLSSERIEIKDYKAFIVPGGFSYGDYLRAGAMARFSVVMQDLIQAGKKGWPILGICNGFQILCEAGLLKGALLPNKQGRFLDRWSNLKLENKNNFWQSKAELKLPIAHGAGSYYIPDDQLKRLQDNNQIWFSYKENPNGSVNNIAGLMNKKGNIAGLMPHPERALVDWMGGTDGFSFFQKLFH
ncbi:MAG: phosphoribosylformylglycinamidine synthase subunit PurQ [Bdellovibrionaceae bacterium]|nr:phosphoribosylformylglycinamidine synthase subunit PurQ [Pseudobdellovibrionaceae bacterium]